MSGKQVAMHGSWLNGWRLTAVAGLGVAAMAAAAMASAPDPVDGARLAIRLTARTSLLLFLATFTASALARLAPSASTRWLRANRRYLGVGFAISHFVHLGAIATLARLDYAVFLQLTNVVSYVAGGLAYLLIVLMTITSFDRTAALIGPRAWAWLHTGGLWYIWFSFALNFGKRVPRDTAYLVPVALLLAALVVRLLAARKRGASARDAAGAARSPYVGPGPAAGV